MEILPVALAILILVPLALVVSYEIRTFFKGAN